MSQHDWSKYLGGGSQAGLERDADDADDSVIVVESVTEPVASADAEGTQKADGAQVGGESADAEKPVAERPDAEKAEAGFAHGTWSGRAVGPLSGLLPGGAVEQNPGDVPAERSAVAVPVGDDEPTMASTGDAESSDEAGTNGHELPTTVAVAQEPIAAADGAGQVPSTAITSETRSDDAANADDAYADVADAVATPQANQTATETAETLEPHQATADDRWHSVLVDFVDDPLRSVEAARGLIDEDIATHVALLAGRAEAMHSAWQGSEDPDTEVLRVALVKYRDLRRRLADVMDVLTT
jgi:hypothetical protein